MQAAAILDRVIDGLLRNGALQPHPTNDDVAGDVGLFLNHPTELPPAAAPLIRFHRAKKVLTEHGKGNHANLQRFFNWQHGFIARGLDLYFPQVQFRLWIQTATTRLVQEPLPPLYQKLIAEHLAKVTSSAGVVDSFPVSKSDVFSAMPAKGILKESIGDLSRAAAVFKQHPQLLLTAVIFQGLHLQFLQQLDERLKQRTDIVASSKLVFDEAIRRLMSNINNANFVRVAIWTGIAHSRRLESLGIATGDVTQEDFETGWALLEKGGGFSTKLSSDKKATAKNIGHENTKSTSVVACPFHKLGKSLVAGELCMPKHGAASHSKAYGLWCIYGLIEETLKTSAPQREVLISISKQVRQSTKSNCG